MSAGNNVHEMIAEETIKKSISRDTRSRSGNDCRIAVVSVESLHQSDSPRLSGEDPLHIQMLAESEAILPPILVHRPTMQVIDGMHRLRAAVLRGQTEIEVEFYLGDDVDVFVAAVEANVAHGLPLSPADRTAAATRIVISHPHWSDRKIASIVGVSGKLVGALRQRVPGNTDSDIRIGRDGRARPHDPAAGRILASELLKERPNASVREIARAAGISPATAHDVRSRLREGDDPVPPRLRSVEAVATAQEPIVPMARRRERAATQAQPKDRDTVLRVLYDDPSLRFNEDGRTLLRWLQARAMGADEWKRFVDAVPEHCVTVLADLARSASDAWRQFADQLENER